VELLFRELKLHYRIEQLPTRCRAVTESLIYAALLTPAARSPTSSMAHRFSSCLRRSYDSRPLGCRPLFSSLAHDVLDVLFGPRDLRLLLARRLKRVLLHEAKDPNLWRLPLADRAQLGSLLPG